MAPKKHKPCSHCHYRRKPFTYTLMQKPLCKICSIEYERDCKVCHSKFPAGFGTVCPNCNYEKILKHKINLYSQIYSGWMQQYFIGFAYWLKNRRGVLYTAMHLHKYQTYFFKIDALAQQLQSLPTYEQLLNSIADATHKKNYLIHIYLDEIAFLTINKVTSEKHANYRLIQKHLRTFGKDTLAYNLIHNYYKFLLVRLQAKKTTLRSIRLALTPAVKFLKYCQNFKETIPTQYALEGYLFLYSGQRATLTGFINFISNTYQYNLDIKAAPKATLTSPKVSHQILKGRLIKIMQNPHDKHFKEAYIFRTIIGYLHWVNVPQNVFISFDNIHKSKNEKYYVTLCGKSFYIPLKIVQYFNQRNNI